MPIPKSTIAIPKSTPASGRTPCRPCPRRTMSNIPRMAQVVGKICTPVRTAWGKSSIGYQQPPRRAMTMPSMMLKPLAWLSVLTNVPRVVPNAAAALALILFASVLAPAALVTALGTCVKTESQASGLSIMLGMVMALLGGCWYPIELFPQAVRTGVQILPTTWAMRGMLDIVLRGQGLQGVLPEAGVLFGMAIVLFGIGIWRFRYE